METDTVQQAPATRPPGSVRDGWTTRGWLGAGSAAVLVLLLVLTGGGVWVLAHATDVNKRLTDRWSPALIASVRMESALINQETGIRGYGMTGKREFLEPYQDGVAQEGTAAQELARLTEGDERATADLARVREDSERWQTTTARPVSEAAEPTASAQQRTESGKAAFDALRASLTEQQNNIEAERDRARDDLQAARTLRNTVFTAIACVVLALIALAFAGLRRGVQLPLDRLRTDVREIADGRFGHTIAASGPADLRALARDVDGMRRRLAGELEFSDRARAQLDEQATELRRSNEELEQFAYVASHDLQEPLRKVASFCQLLERRYAEQLDDRAKQYISFAVDGANRMQTLIGDLLAFSRVGRLHAEDTDVSIEAVLRRTTNSLGMVIEESGAVITHDPLPAVHGDPTQLGVLLQNLISNAIKFRTPGKVPRIHLTASGQEDSAEGAGPRWEFAVSDNGIGIGPEYAERIFVIFQRLHTRDTYPGNGIGLALCKKIVEYHGGTIGLDADHAPGTRFVFSLPSARQDASVTESVN
ncbi:ATP-binding protein [Streptomyces sp. NBC_01201]|uniref:sensor histidine kinase n=1 Tax=unclassified Streptomyces TaxID=2593676 RepID=UPI002E15EB37|nr:MULTISPECIES: ATP-binding protein [unclassified Streptomyces]WSR10799.1 ATP-binding protein [Streptomyces sp. NBC_01208]WSR46505.1 ATP-binding protein [Streptomyces sp. NBC_01201]